MFLGSIAGLVCMGTSIYYNNPFEWSNQGLWLGYVATVLSSTVAICYILDDFPKHVEDQIHNQPVQVGTGPLPAPVFSPIDPSQVLGAHTHGQVSNPFDQVIEDRPLQDASEAPRIEEGLVESPTVRPTRATVP